MTGVTLLCVITFVVFIPICNCEDGLKGLAYDSLDMYKYKDTTDGYKPYSQTDTVQRNSDATTKTSLPSSSSPYWSLNSNAANERRFSATSLFKKQRTGMSVTGASSDIYKPTESSGVIRAQAPTVDTNSVKNPKTASSNMIPAEKQQPLADIKDISKQGNDVIKPALVNGSNLAQPSAGNIAQATGQQANTQGVGTLGTENTYKSEGSKPSSVSGSNLAQPSAGNIAQATGQQANTQGVGTLGTENTYKSEGSKPSSVSGSNLAQPSAGNIAQATGQQANTQGVGTLGTENTYKSEGSKPSSVSGSNLAQPSAGNIAQATGQQAKAQGINTLSTGNIYKSEEMKPALEADQRPSNPVDKPDLEKFVKPYGGPIQAPGDLGKSQNGYAPLLDTKVNEGIKQDNQAMDQAWNAVKPDANNNALPEIRKTASSVDQQTKPMANSYIKPDSGVESKSESGQVLKNTDLPQVNAPLNSNTVQNNLAQTQTGNAMESHVNNNVAMPDSGKSVSPVEQEVKPMVVSNKTPGIEKLPLEHSTEKETAHTGNQLTDKAVVDSKLDQGQQTWENTNNNKLNGGLENNDDNRIGELQKDINKDLEEKKLKENRGKESDGGKEKDDYRYDDDRKGTTMDVLDDIWDDLEDTTGLPTKEHDLHHDDTNAGKDMFESAHHFDSNIGVLGAVGGAKVFDTKTTPKPWKSVKSYGTRKTEENGETSLLSSYSMVMFLSVFVISCAFVLMMNKQKVERYMHVFGLRRQPANNGHFYQARPSDEHKVLLENEYA